MRKTLIAGAVLLVLIVAGLHYALRPQREPRPAEADQPRPIAMRDSVWLEELTYMEVRDNIASGKTTVIVPSGGLEMAGPYLVTGKHNIVARAGCEAIARKLGNALCAPVVAFVPRGNIDPPTQMMHFAGTISVTEETYAALITDIARSMIAHGFRHVILISDNGEKQPVLEKVVRKLSGGRRPGGGTVHFVPEFKIPRSKMNPWVAKELQWEQKKEGLHDDPVISTTIMTINPDLVRIKEREAKGMASINGINLLPVDKAIEAGRKIVDLRSDAAVAAIRKIQTEAKPAAR